MYIIIFDVTRKHTNAHTHACADELFYQFEELNLNKTCSSE